MFDRKWECSAWCVLGLQIPEQWSAMTIAMHLHRWTDRADRLWSVKAITGPRAPGVCCTYLRAQPWSWQGQFPCSVIARFICPHTNRQDTSPHLLHSSLKRWMQETHSVDQHVNICRGWLQSLLHKEAVSCMGRDALDVLPIVFFFVCLPPCGLANMASLKAHHTCWQQTGSLKQTPSRRVSVTCQIW